MQDKNSVNLNHSAEDCESIRDLVADYAFGLTDADETRRVEAALPGCPEAVQELTDYRRIQDELRENVPQVAPPAALRAKLMTATGAAVIPTMPTRTRAPLAINRGWLAAAAAIALLVVTNLYWLTRPSVPDGAHVVQSGPEAGPFVVDNTTGLRWTRIPGEQAEDVAAFIMWGAESKIGLMYAVGMPQLEADRVYELWLNRDGERVSVGSFVVDESGEAALLFSSDKPIDDFLWAWITEEPAGGSPQPSENIIARGDL